MVPTAIRKDPLTQYLLAFSLVIVIVGSVGAVAQMLHFEELPSLAYTATILVPAALFVVAAVLYNRLFDTATVPASSEDDDTTTDERPAPDGEAVTDGTPVPKGDATDEIEADTKQRS